MLATKPTPQASCSLRGSYRPCFGGRLISKPQMPYRRQKYPSRPRSEGKAPGICPLLIEFNLYVTMPPFAEQHDRCAPHAILWQLRIARNCKFRIICKYIIYLVRTRRPIASMGKRGTSRAAALRPTHAPKTAKTGATTWPPPRSMLTVIR